MIRKLALVTAALLFISAGVLHFRIPGPYAKIVPPFLPWPLAIVYISGCAEIAGGIGLLIPKLRQFAAWGLVVLLVAVFPANIYMAMGQIQVTADPLPSWVLWARLPLQFLLIWWVLWSARPAYDPSR